MEIRRFEGTGFAETIPVWSQAFEGGNRELDDWREWEKTHGHRWKMYGVYDEGGLQATIFLVNAEMFFGPEQTLPFCIVNGVACLPAARGKRYAAHELAFAFERMREEGQFLSVLDCFSWEFYQGHGYDWIGLRRRYVVPSRELKPSAETEFVRAATKEDRKAILSLYREYAGRYRGMMARTAEEWDGILDDAKKEFVYTYVYERDGKIEGYLTHKGLKREETRLREFLCLTPLALRGLLGLLRRHDMQVQTFAWYAPPDDMLYSHYLHNELQATWRPCTMGRIVDVAGVLQAWKPLMAVNGSVNVAIEDAQCPWNAGTWRVECENGMTTAAPTTGNAQVMMHVRQLAQAFWGTPSLSELRRAGKVQVHEEAGFEVLRQILDGPPMWIDDTF